MIAHLSGTVRAIGATWIVVDVQGVGFSILCTPATASSQTLGAQATLHTHLGVREDALTLYGFESVEEREAFLLVQSVSGIGPKMALSIVSHLSAAQLSQAIMTENLLALTKVPGVGPKIAGRIHLELKDKAGRLSDTRVTIGDTSAQDQVILGLQGLGYSAKDALGAWENVHHLQDEDSTVSTLMRAALRTLAKG